MEQAICSKNWENRCARSKSKICRCDCGGINHGNIKAYKSKEAKKLLEKLDEKKVVKKVRNEKGVIEGSVATKTLRIRGDLVRPTLSLNYRNHSPDGFMWGYAGSGPAQLSLAILLELIDSDKALKLYHDFKFAVIASLDKDKDFEIPVAAIYKWVDKQEVK